MSRAATIVADVAVLGAGAAGAVVARKVLDAGGARVALVEAGPDYGPFETGGWPPDLLNADTLPASHDWGYRGPGRGGNWRFDRARVVGGCTAHNGCSQTSGVRDDFEALDMRWLPGELDARIARQLEASRAEVPSDDEITPFQSAIIEGFAEVGIPRTDDLGSLDGGVGCGPAPMNSPAGVRWNSAFAHLDDVRQEQRFEIVAETMVDRLVVEGGRVVMAICRDAGGIRIVRASEFVLCAGAYGSPEILLRSGIGPADELRQIGIEVVADLRGVGANLHDHPTVELRFAAAPELARATTLFARARRAPDEQAIAKAWSGHGAAPYDLHLFPYTELVDGRLECVLPAGLLAPRSRGKLRLRTQDPTERAHLDHRYLSDSGGLDLRALDAGLDLVRATASSAALAPYLRDAVFDPSTGADRVFGHYWHPAGTCALGLDPDAGAVVDQEGRVFGVGNLRVVDASVFPTVPRATTHLPVGVLADRLSDELVGATCIPHAREAVQ